MVQEYANHFNLVHAHKPKFGLFTYVFGIPLSKFLSFIFLCLFSALLLSLPIALHLLSGCRKKLNVNYHDYWQRLEMEP